MHGILRKRPAAVILKFYSVRTAVFINSEGKNGKRGACVRRACCRVSGSRNASGGRVRNVISACAAPGSQVFVFALYSATVPGRRVYGASCGTAVCADCTASPERRQFMRFPSQKGVPSYFCRAADCPRRGSVFPPSSSACIQSAALYIRPLRRLRICLRTALQIEHM